ncbi:MAG: agmatinase [Microcystis aeruginosa W13-15]|nr:agmatinase [Microcystis aeruginosa W13-15]
MLLSCATGSEQFLGSEAIASYATAKAVILPIPYEATTTYRKGCETGPAAVITASQQLEAYDEELKRETCLEVGIYTHEAIADTRQQPQLSAEEMLAVTTATVSREHAITTGVVQAYQQALSEPFTVVQIDAHGDMRFEYEGSHHNHACVMRRVLEMGLPTLPVGIRAICREEAELIAKQQIPVVWDRDIAGDPDWIEKAIAKITTEKVFLTIDVDGIDPALIPGVGTPEPGGLSWHQTLGFLRRLFQTHQVIGCDVMELAPISDSVVSEFTTAKLIYKLIGYQFIA